MDAAIITAISGLVTGLIGIMIAALTARNSAQKAELDSLRTTITTLQAENKRLFDRVTALENGKKHADECNDKLEDEIRVLRGQNAGMADRIVKLERKVIALGGKPDTGELKS